MIELGGLLQDRVLRLLDLVTLAGWERAYNEHGSGGFGKREHLFE